MLAQGTTNTTYITISIVTFVILMVPIYVMTLKGAQGYGRLEQKVDNIALAQSQANAVNAETARSIAETVGKLTDQFQAHAVQDAGHFGELRGMLATQPPKTPSV